jgi:hypothetical protein
MLNLPILLQGGNKVVLPEEIRKVFRENGKSIVDTSVKLLMQSTIS